MFFASRTTEMSRKDPQSQRRIGIGDCPEEPEVADSPAPQPSDCGENEIVLPGRIGTQDSGGKPPTKRPPATESQLRGEPERFSRLPTQAAADDQVESQ